MYIIPVEANLKLSLEHMSQLAHYVSTLSSWKTNITVGILIDVSQLRVAFSLLEEAVPLVLVSPLMQWRKWHKACMAYLCGTLPNSPLSNKVSVNGA